MEIKIKIRKQYVLVFLAAWLSLGFKPYDNFFEFSKNMEIFNAAYKALGRNYVDDVNPGDLMRKGIDAMFGSLDPYTNFFSEAQAEEALIDRNREYGGVGSRSIIRDKQLVVSEVFDGYSFAAADIRPGDIIKSIEGQNMYGKSLADLSVMLRGAPGSTIQMVISRDNVDINKTITRQQVRSKNVPFFGMVNEDVGYIKLDEFGDNCSQEVTDAFLKLKAKKMKKVILDLRFNGGGLLNEAVNIIGLFSGPGKKVVTMRGRNADNNKDWITSNAVFDTEIPVVVLVNSQSASASEVVSGGLQDLDRAVIIGRNSFGKGLVQNYVNLPYRTQMKLTIAKYYCPSGRCVQLKDYSRRNADGSAQEVAEDKRKAFKTLSGRTVYDGGGVKPDLIVDEFGGQNFYKSMVEELYFFDFANVWRNNHEKPENPEKFELSSAELNKFLDESAEKLQKSYRAKLLEYAEKAFGDKELAKDWLAKNGDEKWLKESIFSKIQKVSSLIKFRLEQEILKRYYISDALYQNSFSSDPDLLMAIKTLGNPQSYSTLLKP